MRATYPSLLALSLSLLLIGSASAQDARPRRDPNEINQEELATPGLGQLTLLRAIQQIRPNWFRARGAPSIMLGGSGWSTQMGGRATPGDIVDNVRQPLERLESLRASDVSSLVFLSAGDATTRYGTGYPNGAILVTTVNGRP